MSLRRKPWGKLFIASTLQVHGPVARPARLLTLGEFRIQRQPLTKPNNPATLDKRSRQNVIPTRSHSFFYIVSCHQMPSLLQRIPSGFYFFFFSPGFVTLPYPHFESTLVWCWRSEGDSRSSRLFRCVAPWNLTVDDLTSIRFESRVKDNYLSTEKYGILCRSLQD